MKKILIFLLFGNFFFIFQCGNNPPIVYQSYYQIRYYDKGVQGIKNKQLYLGIIINMTDENGTDDITDLIIQHVETETVWNLSQDKRERFEFNNNDYFGSAWLTYKKATSVLLGDYLIKIMDRADNITLHNIHVTDHQNKSSGEFKLENIKNYQIKKIKNKYQINTEKFQKLDLIYLKVNQKVPQEFPIKNIKNNTFTLANNLLQNNKYFYFRIIDDYEENFFYYIIAADK